MCGIAGYVSEKKNIDEIISITNAMIDEVYWRGPDDKGVKVINVNNRIIGLAHRRLSIMDLSTRGHQPMQSKDGRYLIVYNGEIYNYRSIRDNLSKLGYSFTSNCDTEVVLYACIEYGVEKAVLQFNGMWAFAFIDKESGLITLSRDRLGVKPLYYYKTSNEFAFASDMRSFYNNVDLKKRINYRALHGYIWNMYIPAPYSILEGVFKLEPGCNIHYDVISGEIKEIRYWSPRTVEQSFNGSYDDYLDEIEKVLTDSVRLRLDADVPVGVFLSGGVDSSIISSLAQKESIRKINTYSIGFTEKVNDDAKVAFKVANVLGTNHKELYCTQHDALELIENIPDAYSEPFADNSQIPTMLLCRMTKKHVTVALSGDGGDEFFMGYPSYIGKETLMRNRNKISILSSIMNRAAKKLPLYNHNRWKFEKLYNASTVTKTINLEYITANNLINSIFKSEYKNIGDLELFGGKYYEESGRGVTRGLNLQSIEYGLPDDMLTKVDRASMYYSLECRCPILDYRLAELTLSAPLGYNLNKGQLKAPLKDILYKYVPHQIVDRPKSGFGVPINKWLHDELNEIVNDNLSSELVIRQGIFDRVGMEKFVNEFNKCSNPNLDRVAYTLLIFQLWWERYCN